MYKGQVQDLKGKQVRSLACGQYHTVIACENGDVFGFGRNECGQLGCPSQKTADNISNKPIKISGLKSHLVACGYYHTVAISEDN